MMLLGVAYYPEHWPEDRWPVDAKLMKEAGITRVRIGEFAWHRMEPREGTYDFDWLKRVVELLGRHGIKTILGTPTPTYPAWLHKKYPDLHEIASNGVAREFGMRQDACKNHPRYREHARRIVEQMAAAMGNHPDVAAWQTDNEFGCHGSARCWCDYCRAAFQSWLRERFQGDIAALNAAWGTFFWSQDYNDFDEISVPRDTANGGNDGQNPGLVLDFYRFSSEVQVRFQREQIEVLLRLSPGRLITHNLMGAFRQVNYFDLARALDIVSWDNYPFGTNGTNLPPRPLNHDLMRGVKQQNVWVMEQASGPGGWGSYSATPQPGQMRLWAWQSVAHGADMVSFFRWRTCRWGREQFWHGILYHHGHPQRRYEEAKRLGAEFRRVSKELDGSTVESPVAILYPYDTVWALETQPNARSGFEYNELAGDWAHALSRMGVTADAIEPAANLHRYKVIIAPTLHLCTPEIVRKLTAFVRAGGTLILGPRSGVKDVENAVVDEFLPGPLAALAGCHVEEYDNFSHAKGVEMTVRDRQGAAWPAKVMADVLVPARGAKVLLTYGAHYYAGRAAAVESRRRAGRCIYLGTVLDESGLKAFLTPVLKTARVGVAESLPASVEVVRRARKGRDYAFYLNYNAAPVTVDLARPGLDLLTGKRLKGQAAIAGFNLLIVKE